MSAWPEVPLASIVSIKGGGTPSKEKAEFWGGCIPWVSPKDMKSELIGTSIDTITEEATRVSPAKLIPVGSALIVVRSGILARMVPIATTTRPLTVNQDIKALVSGPKLDAGFLVYFLRSAEPELLGHVTRGATVHRLSTESIRSLQIPLPPLAEQKRIVAILDAAFEGIDTAIANAEQNLANARALFETERDAVFALPPAYWRRCVLADMCDKFEYGTASKSKPAGRSPVLRMGNLQNGELDWSDLVFSDDDGECAKYALRSGDVLFNRTNSAEHVGKAAIYRGEREAIFAGYLIRVRYRPDEVDGEFLNLYLASSVARNHGASVMSRSVNQANISGSKLKRYPFAAPPIGEQRRLSARLLALRETVGELERVYSAKLRALIELRQALLRQAFEGRLAMSAAAEMPEAAE